MPNVRELSVQFYRTRCTYMYIHILCPVNLPKKYNKNPSEETREDNLCELWPILDAHDLER